jgi:uncharacterized protein YigA (DUF484 family)
MVDIILGEQGVVRMGETGFGALLFPNAAVPVESCALVRLALWQPASAGILCFGSSEIDAFSPDMGVELIVFIARVVERTAERWPIL